MKFTDCIDIVGERPKKFDGYRKYVSTGALNTDHIDENAVELVDYETRPSRADLIAEPGDVLFAKMAATKKTLLLDTTTSKYIYSTGFFAIRAKKSIIEPECLQLLVNSDLFLTQKDKNASGATQRAITNKGLEAIEIALPPIQAQETIVKKLLSISAIVSARKQQLSALDTLIKARFVEMFGTLDNPTKLFPYETLKSLCVKITDGKHGGCTIENGTDRYFVGAREIFDDKVHYETAPEINSAEFEKDYKRCNLEIGDFLIVNTGATIGKSAIAEDTRTEHTLLQKSVALLKVKTEQLHPVFLKYCYKVNERMYRVESASAQPNLLLSKINSTNIYVPKMDEQIQFAAFVSQVDKSKFVCYNYTLYCAVSVLCNT